MPKIKVEKLIEAIESDSMEDFFEILNKEKWLHDDYCAVIEYFMKDCESIKVNENYQEMMKVLSNRSGILI